MIEKDEEQSPATSGYCRNLPLTLRETIDIALRYLYSGEYGDANGLWSNELSSAVSTLEKITEQDISLVDLDAAYGGSDDTEQWESRALGADAKYAEVAPDITDKTDAALFGLFAGKTYAEALRWTKNDPSVHFDLMDRAIRDDERDPLDALRDAEILSALQQLRWAEITKEHQP